MANRPEHEWEVNDAYTPPRTPVKQVELAALKLFLEQIEIANRPDHKGRTNGLENLEKFVVDLAQLLNKNGSLILERT